MNNKSGICVIELAGTILRTNPWILFKENSLPECLVDIYNEKFGEDIIRKSRQLYWCEKAIANLYWIFTLVMIPLALVIQGNLIAIIPCVIAFFAVANIISKTIRKLEPCINKFRESLADFMECIDYWKLNESISNSEKDMLARPFSFRLIPEEAFRQAAYSRQLTRAKYLRKCELCGSDIAFARSQLSGASDAANVFGFGVSWKKLFSVVNPEIYKERFSAFDPVI